MWNYWLGGKDNFAVDRAAAERVLEVMPTMPLIARAAQLFLVEAVQRLAGEHGVRQSLDIGTGLPVADNTHQIAQRVAPESRIVYVDYDPIVLLNGLPGDVFQRPGVGAAGGTDQPGFPALDDPLGAAVGFPGPVPGLADGTGELVLGQDAIGEATQRRSTQRNRLRVNGCSASWDESWDEPSDNPSSVGASRAMPRDISAVRAHIGINRASCCRQVCGFVFAAMPIRDDLLTQRPCVVRQQPFAS
jgi:hypothetical protein